MKKYRILIAGLLLLSASCTDETERNGQGYRQGDGSFRVTASIEDAGAMSRVADINDRTSFTKNDEIFIGWSGSASYKYLCSGTDNVFVPNADTDRKLWSDLLSTSPTVDVYAWYGTMNSSLPAVGTNVSISQNQTSESKLKTAICMAAHKAISPATNTLDFSFRHLTARLFLSVDIVDPTVEQVDVMGATAQINHIYADGTIATDASGDYQLSVPDNKAGTQSIRMKQSWSDQKVYHLDFECLLPPQTLGKGQSVTVTLANGKEYVCSVSSDLTLSAGQKTSLIAILKADASADFKPKLSKIPNAVVSAFSGNRLICAIRDPASEELRYRVYDKQLDNSWGEGVLVYEDEEGTVEFPTVKYSGILKKVNELAMYGDYVGLGISEGNSTFYIKKSKKTGKWYCDKGYLLGGGYGICISKNFLVSGNGGAYNSYIYPIDEDGNLGDPEYKPAGISAWKCSIFENILTTDSGVYEYVPGTGWKYLRSRVGDRSSTDGKRVIGATNRGSANIYNIKTGQTEGWTGSRPASGVGLPFGIYDNYALVGNDDNGIKLCYRNPVSGTWSVIGPSGGFLEMMKHWDNSITLTKINGSNLSMKGTHAMIVDNISSTSFFIENIDKIVEDYLANPY
jgi:hypothetical protein